ncbi:threonine ammonia-lyase [Acidiferrimicrobium sp. IK]|uniref:threonine ammonia-lyase n=1 Tax=Acidiferrimicrobium sp. IK TaxID=2871700 RepID=UPI0021CB76E0|nr:threonine ammonia-lyase [Acidiferrimicrobium sp. IK]MCU4186313.1 threonine ammonia-lyase [Acidiferrimicrobium sp. IK]
MTPHPGAPPRPDPDLILTALSEISAARQRVAPVLRPTPVDHSDSLSRVAGRPVLLKAEYLQRTGSFKIRGAYNRICQLPPGVEVVAASAGNHAQGVALAAALTGRHSTIFMPATAALPKTEATRAYGATVRLEGEVVDDCILAAQAFAAERGAVFVPPFDDPDIIAGQATLGLEVAEEAPDAEVVVVPVGGGGLLAGTAAALHHVAAHVRVVGVEAAGAASLSAALAAGRPVLLDSVATMADGIAVRMVSELTLAHAQAYVDEVVTVDEEEISRAMLLLVERAKGVVEPSGAAALAAILAGRVPGHGPALAVLSGGNVDPLLLTKLINHGLTAAGRYLVLRIVVGDRPGALAGLTAQLAAMRLNVLDVEHHRSGRALALTEVEVAVTVETRDHEHHREILRELADAGYQAEPLS